MSKQTPEQRLASRDREQEDFKEYFGITQSENANRPERRSSLVGENNIGFSGQGKLGKSTYDQGYMPGLDFFEDVDSGSAEEMINLGIDENRAQMQSKGEKLLNGVGRTLSKAVSEVGKGIGYVGGIPAAIINQDITEITDNFLVNTFQNLEDGAKEMMPVYARKELEERGLWGQVWSPEFWATEGADGLGFLLSAIATGGTLSGIAKGAKIGTGIAKMVGQGSKVAGAIDNVVISAAQSYLEGAAETKGMVDELKHYWGGRRSDKGYDSGKKDANGETIYYDQEKIDELIGNAGVSTLGLNALFLMGGNMLQTKFLFGKNNSPSGIINSLDKTSVETMQSSLNKVVPWKTFTKEMASNSLLSGGSEAFQELSQFAIENYESKKGKAMTNSNLIEGLAEGFYEGMTTIEGQKSMFLGAVLGIGPAAIQSYKETKKDIKASKGLVKLLNESSKSFKDDITSIYKKNEDGSLKLENDKPIVDIDKFFEMMDSSVEDNVLAKIYGAGVLSNNVDVTRKALNDMTLRNLYNYLEVDGGIEIWKEHLDAFSEIMEKDYASLGFKDKSEYKEYMYKIGETAAKEHAKVIDRGPSFFGFNMKGINIDGLSAKEVETEKRKVTSRVEYQAVRHKVFTGRNNDRIAQINSEIQALIEEDAKTVLNPDKELKETLKESKQNQAEINRLTKIMRSLEDDNFNSFLNYETLFDKDEQSIVLKKSIDKLKASKAKAKEETSETEESEETEKTPLTDDEQLVQDFYKNLEAKGYDVQKGKEGATDFGKGVVTLKDKEGNVYRVFKDKAKIGEYKVINLTTNKVENFSLAKLKKIGIGSESILSKEEFKKWDKSRQIVIKNEARLNSIKNVIRRHFDNRTNKETRVNELLDKLKSYQNELSIAYELDPDMSVDSITEDIIVLESQIKEIENEIETIGKDIYELNGTLELLFELKSELLNAIENETEYSFGITLNKLREELENGNLDANVQLIDESIEVSLEIEKELKDTLADLNKTLNFLYDELADINDLDTVFSSLNGTTKLINFLEKHYPHLIINGNLIRDLDNATIKELLKIPEIRQDLIERIRGEKQNIMSMYALEKETASKVARELKKVQDELQKLYANRPLAKKYDRLLKNYKNLLYINDISIIGSIKAGDFQSIRNEEQDDIGLDESVLKKKNAFSTSSQIYKGSRDENGNYIVERYPKGHPLSGQKVLNDNYEQGARWDEALAEIPLDKLDQYEVRFVNSSQLESLGQEAPSDKEGDVYAVLYSILDQSPNKDSEGKIIFTGVPFVDTMFGDTWTSIDIDNMAEYRKALSTEITEDKPFTYKGEAYTNPLDLRNDIITELKEKYETFRNGIVESLEKGESQYTSLRDVSAGIPIYTDIKSNPRQVLDIANIVIPNSSTISKKNNAVVDVQPGRVYVELKNGQFVRVNNNKIVDLEAGKRGLMLDRIIKFISLAAKVENGNFRQEFEYDGVNTKEKIPLVGDNKKPGILDFFINWGISKDKPNGIALFQKDDKSGYELRFKINNVSDRININDMFDEKGNVLSHTSPSLMNLVVFLENKYLNVNNSLLNKKTKSLKIPRNITKTGKISYDKVESMSDYYLDNDYLYTNIKKHDNELDQIPNFVNRYVSYGNTVKTELSKPTVKKEPEAPTTKTNEPKAPRKKNSLSSLASKTPEVFFDSPPVDVYNDDFIPEDKGGNDVLSKMDELFSSMQEKVTIVEEDEVKTKDDTHCPPVKKPGMNNKISRKPKN